MKPQDIAFVLSLLLLLFLRKPRLFVIAGLVLLALSVPLFQLHVFFTAQRLVMYAAGLVFISSIWMVFDLRRNK